MGITSRIRRHPATVEFGETECCALKRAMTDPQHEPLIREFRERARKEHALGHVASLLSEIFERTFRLVFIPQVLHRTFYIALAFSEKDYLATLKPVVLPCGHAVSAHMAAIKNICFMMAHPEGHN